MNDEYKLSVIFLDGQVFDIFSRLYDAKVSITKQSRLRNIFESRFVVKRLSVQDCIATLDREYMKSTGYAYKIHLQQLKNQLEKSIKSNSFK